MMIGWVCRRVESKAIEAITALVCEEQMAVSAGSKNSTFLLTWSEVVLNHLRMKSHN